MSRSCSPQPSSFPGSQRDLLRRIAVETARMSYPAGMTRGANSPALNSSDCTIKMRLEHYFRDLMPLTGIWSQRIHDYDGWHKRQTIALAEHLLEHEHIPEDRHEDGIAAKFLNTYMHQLMKYEAPRYLYTRLHLTLDQKILDQLKRMRWPELAAIDDLLKNSPYKMAYWEYAKLQSAIARFIERQNTQLPQHMTIRSRVELNWLWAVDK